MSDRGSILISTANDIGEALVEKLGGEGYAPSVWDKEYNKLGIAEVDSAPALSVLEDSSSAETARGSILLSTANAIGAVLNKKYYTERGFKPKEWASAASKLAPLPEKSAESSPICAIDDGADTVPLTSCEISLPASLDGYSEVDAVHCGINIFNQQTEIGGYNTSDGEANNLTDRIRNTGYISVKPSTQYYIYNGTDISSQSNINIVVLCYDKDKQYTGSYYYKNKTQPILSIPADSYYIRFYCATGYGTTYNNDISINYPETETAFHAYVGETYTASLGRTIYGGTADIVNGTGTDGYKKITLNSLLDGLTMTQIGTAGVYRVRFNLSDAKGAANTTVFSGLCDYYTPSTANQTYTQNEGIAINTSGQCFIYDSRFNTSASLNDFKTWIDANPVNLCYELATGSDFTFTGQEIPTKDGYNAFWSDQGNTALDYYGAPEPYTRGTASGAIANVQSARTDLPFTMVKANIAPNLTGVESVEVTKTGKNLFNKENPNEVDGYITTTGFSTSDTSAKTIYIPIVGGATYTVSKTAGQRFYLATAEVIPSNNAVFTSRQANNTATSISITAGANDKYLWAWIYLDGTDTGTLDDMLSSVQIEVGSTATEYTPYEEPTVYTADLGRTVYGGYADIVNGTGTDENGNDFTFNGQVVRVSPGVNNLWNNAGGDTDVEYFTQE